MNIINLHLAVTDPDAVLTITHNQTVLYQAAIQNQLTLTVTELLQHNQLTVLIDRGQSEILDITFFDLGSKKLCALGYVAPRGQPIPTTRLLKNMAWHLDYEYPVFYWIRKQLNLGQTWHPDVV